MLALHLRAPLALALACFSVGTFAQVAIDGAVQDFDSLANTGTSSTLPVGWFISEVGSGSLANGEYTAGTGSATAGDTYSFGSAASSERALGVVASGSVVATLGAQLQNTTGGQLTEVLVSFTTEQWRLGALNGADRLVFAYSTNATSLTTGTWTAVSALDVVSPVTTGTIDTPRDGNAAGNFTDVSATISGLSLANGATLWVRWTDTNDDSTDDGLAIDDVSFGQAVDNPPTLLMTSSPADNAINVPVGSAIQLNFSEIVATGPDPWFTLTCGGNAVAASAGGSGASRTITPAAALPFASHCVVELDESRIVDIDGAPDALIAGAGYTDFDFDTAADTAPTVSSIVPAHNATGVAATANVAITFSEAVNVAPVAAGWIDLECDGANVAGAVSGGPTTWTFDPAASLTPGAACTVTLNPGGVNDIDGTPQALTGQLVFAFAVAPDLAPALASSYPIDGATNVPPASDLTVVFTEAVDATPDAFTLECPAGVAVSLAGGSADGITWELAPSADLPADTDCVLSIEADAIADRDGTPDALAADIVIDFTTGAGLTGYYERVDASSCRALRATLHGVIDDHSAVVYSDTGNAWTPGDPSTYDVWEVLNLADEDPNDPSKVLDIYRNESYTKIAGGTDVYNREHTWPNSHGFNDLLTLDGAPNAPYTDTHMLMVSNSDYNTRRSNRAYGPCNPSVTANCTGNFVDTIFNASNGVGGGPLGYVTSGEQLHNFFTPNFNEGDGSFEVWHYRRGDIARAMLYMDVRYEGGRNSRNNQREPDLILTDNENLIVATPKEFVAAGYSGRLTPLLAWAAGDAPTPLEGLRNDVVESVQGNRNPFTDHPEWVAIAFAAPCTGPDVIAVDDDFRTAQNTVVNAAAPGALRDDRNGTSTNGEGLTASVVTQPLNGSLVLSSNGSFTYTPANGFCGNDSFTYLASDGANSDQGTVYLRVCNTPSGNAQPVANNATFALAENSAAGTTVGQVVATDADVGQTLSYAITAGNGAGAFAINAANGTITVANSTPLNREATPQFVLTVIVTDNGTPPSFDGATITINLTDVEEGPAAANNDAFTLNEDSGANALAVLANDTVDPDTLSIAVTQVTTALHGSTSFTATGVSYTPAANYCGPDQFTYTVTGGDSATVNLTVTCLLDDGPRTVATLPDRTFVAGAPIAEFHISPAFASGDLPLMFYLDNAPPGLSVDQFGGHVNGTPTTPGVYLVTARVDNGLGTATQTFTVTVTPAPDTGDAIANDDDVTVIEDSGANAIDVLSNDTADPDTNLIAVTGVSTPAHGSATFTAGNVGYTPAANYCGDDSFTYSVTDGDTATVNVTVTCAGDAPTTVGTLPDRSATVTIAMAPFSVTAGFAIAPGDGAATYSADGLPAGVMIDAAGTVSGTPPAGSEGEYAVTVRATNASGQATQTFTLTVRGLPIFADGFED